MICFWRIECHSDTHPRPHHVVTINKRRYRAPRLRFRRHQIRHLDVVLLFPPRFRHRLRRGAGVALPQRRRRQLGRLQSRLRLLAMDHRRSQESRFHFGIFRLFDEKREVVCPVFVAVWIVTGGARVDQFETQIGVFRKGG